MSTSFKYILSIVLLIASGIMIFMPTSLKISAHKKRINNNDIPTQNNLSTFLETLDFDVKNNTAKILPVIFLNTGDCFICINNVFEFDTLIEKDTDYGRLVAVFIDEEEKQVQRFLNVLELNVFFRIMESEKIDPFFVTEEKIIIFIDRNTRQLLYSHKIPNAISSMEHKREMLLDVKNIRLKLSQGYN